MLFWIKRWCYSQKGISKKVEDTLLNQKYPLKLVLFFLMCHTKVGRRRPLGNNLCCVYQLTMADRTYSLTRVPHVKVEMTGFPKGILSVVYHCWQRGNWRLVLLFLMHRRTGDRNSNLSNIATDALNHSTIRTVTLKQTDKKTKNLIYEIPCMTCPKEYIGMTT